MKKTKNIRDEKPAQIRVKGDINEFNLDVGFIGAMLDVLCITDSEEFNRNTIPALAYEARHKLERAREYGNSLWDVAREAGLVKVS